MIPNITYTKVTTCKNIIFMFKQSAMPSNIFIILFPSLSIKTISTNRIFTKSIYIMNRTIRVFKYRTFAFILRSTISTNLLPFIILKSKRRNNIPTTKTFNKIYFPRSRTTRITMRSKHSNSFKNLLIYPIIWATFSFTISSKFKFFYCMLTNIRISNNII